MLNRSKADSLLWCYIWHKWTSRKWKKLKCYSAQKHHGPATIAKNSYILGTVHLASLWSHITNVRLLKKELGCRWIESHQKSLQTIKDVVCKEMQLSYFDPEKLVIQVDASNRGLGAVLLQEGKPIVFASKSLTVTEQRYANIERELLAVVFGYE